MEYENKKGKIEAEFERKSGQTREKLEGKPAAAAIEKWLSDAAMTERTNPEDALSKLVSVLNVNPGDVQEIELSVKFSNGKEINIEKKQPEQNQSKGKHEDSHGPGNGKGHGKGNGKK